MANNDLMQQFVQYYNNTIHRSTKLTPIEMMANPDREADYIRDKIIDLRLAKNAQRFRDLDKYKRGDIIWVHVDYSKTQLKHTKIRRQMNEKAVFLKYRNGNVVCKLLDPIDNFENIIEVPIYYTRLDTKGKHA
jgi:hypothetical protein